jgi:hypothetical protein
LVLLLLLELLLQCVHLRAVAQSLLLALGVLLEHAHAMLLLLQHLLLQVGSRGLLLLRVLQVLAGRLCLRLRLCLLLLLKLRRAELGHLHRVGRSVLLLLRRHGASGASSSSLRGGGVHERTAARLAHGNPLLRELRVHHCWGPARNAVRGTGGLLQRRGHHRVVCHHARRRLDRRWVVWRSLGWGLHPHVRGLWSRIDVLLARRRAGVLSRGAGGARGLEPGSLLLGVRLSLRLLLLLLLLLQQVLLARLLLLLQVLRLHGGLSW